VRSQKPSTAGVRNGLVGVLGSCAGISEMRQFGNDYLRTEIIYGDIERHNAGKSPVRRSQPAGRFRPQDFFRVVDGRG
jgi:hypothetical protein